MKNALIFAFILLLIGGAFFCGALIANGGFRFDKELTTKNVAIDEDFSSVLAELYTTDIKLLPSQDEKCTIVLHEKDTFSHTVEVKNGALCISEPAKRKWTEFLFGHKGPIIEIYLPKAEYASLDIDCSTGNIYVSDAFTFDEIDIEVSTGDIELYASARGTVSLEATTGDILANGVHAESVEISTTTGSAVIKNATIKGEVSFEVGTGKIEADTVLAKKIEIEGGSGKKTLNNLTIEGDACVESTTGGVSITNMQSSKLFMKLSTGDALLKKCLVASILNIQATTGDITFDASDAGEIEVKTNTGSITGTLLAGKIFDAKSTSGKVIVPPNDLSQGTCKLTTTSGRIELKIK